MKLYMLVFNDHTAELETFQISGIVPSIKFPGYSEIYFPDNTEDIGLTKTSTIIHVWSERE